MSQTSYPTEMANGLAGDLADAGPHKIDSGRNAEASATLGFGTVVGAFGTTQDDYKLLTSALEVGGVACRSVAFDNIGLGSVAGVDVPAKRMFNVLKKGRVLVAVEVTVAKGDKAYARLTTGVVDNTMTTKGALRNDNDGVAQVTTLTPTPANSGVSNIAVLFEAFEGSPAQLFSFTFTADGSATAAEWVTGFQAVMAADAAFTALCVATGTTTLILTGQQKGRKFDVAPSGAASVAIAATTPASVTAKWLAGARFLKGAAAGALAVLDFDLNSILDR